MERKSPKPQPLLPSKILVVRSTLLNLDEITLIEVIGPTDYKFAISFFVSPFYLELAGLKMA